MSINKLDILKDKRQKSVLLKYFSFSSDAFSSYFPCLNQFAVLHSWIVAMPIHSPQNNITMYLCDVAFIQHVYLHFTADISSEFITLQLQTRIFSIQIKYYNNILLSPILFLTTMQHHRDDTMRSERELLFNVILLLYFSEIFHIFRIRIASLTVEERL